MLFEEDYKTIKDFATGEFRDRGSRFIGFAYPVKSELQVKELVQKCRKDHPKANHHCYAFRLGPGKNIFRFSDDREPSGSAGKPIYGSILSNDLTDILIIVVRYFGGTLLGVPGLIYAYRSGAEAAIHNAEVITLPFVERYQLTFNYEFMNEAMTVIRMSKVKILNQELNNDCKIDVEVLKKSADDFLGRIQQNHILAGNCKINVI